MTEAQYLLILLIMKGIAMAGERLAKVGGMTDAECRAAMPLVQAEIDANDKIIASL